MTLKTLAYQLLEKELFFTGVLPTVLSRPPESRSVLESGYGMTQGRRSTYISTLYPAS